MHADIHLRMHALIAAELHREAAARRHRPARVPAPAPALRVRLGWRLVELGLRLVTPDRHPAALAA
ncbi:hypothetical protein ACHGLA_13760 [Streptomyces sp. YH02]|uniref:hypothetical protein n=1 Tax=Streptomyces sp. YH02 TaxID=3256999 RepID=UPI00375715BB